jgi:hypothetical protein
MPVRASSSTINRDPWGAGFLTFAVGLAKQHLGAAAATELASAAGRFHDLGAPVLELRCQLLAMREGSTTPAAHRVVERPRALRMRGAHALALATLASVSPNGQRRDMGEATQLAKQCGIPLPACKLDVNGAHVTTAAAADLSVARVNICCFGGYRVKIDGRIADLAQLRPQALHVLQLLSLSPEDDHHREFLEDILWPGGGHSVACHRLQVAVSSVRTMFGGGEVIIRRRGESYPLCLPIGASVDVRDFTNALSRADALSARGDRPGRVSAREEALSFTPVICCRKLRRPNISIVNANGCGAVRPRRRQRCPPTTGRWVTTRMRLPRRSGPLSSIRTREIPWLILADLHEKVGDLSSAEYARREHARMRADLEISTV